MIRYEKYSRN